MICPSVRNWGQTEAAIQKNSVEKLFWNTSPNLLADAYLQPCQTSKFKLFGKFVNDWKLKVVN